MALATYGVLPQPHTLGTFAVPDSYKLPQCSVVKRPLSESTNFAVPAPKRTRTSPRKHVARQSVLKDQENDRLPSPKKAKRKLPCTHGGQSDGPCVHETTVQPIAWSEWTWKFDKETEYAPPDNTAISSRHPQLNNRMRSVLFEWLGEVCHEHFLQTQTYYMAMDYVNRYLYFSQDVPRTQFQLIGATALLIAAKIQEVHPPHAIELAELTLGACTARQIAEKELEMVQVLRWRLCPPTVCDWVMQFFSDNAEPEKPRAPAPAAPRHVRAPTPRKVKALRHAAMPSGEQPAEPIKEVTMNAAYQELQAQRKTEHSSLMRRFTLTDDAMLAYQCAMALANVGSLSATACEFPPSMLAAAALHLTGAPVPVDALVIASGYSPAIVSACIQWLKPVHEMMRKETALPTKETVRSDILCHTRTANSLNLLDLVEAP